MKFDVVRAWKDETYRQNLSSEQRSSLPTNPVGELELTDAELAYVSGGSISTHTSASSASASTARIKGKREEHVHSFTLVACDVNVFSLNVSVLGVSLISIGSPHTSICINNS